MKKLKENSAITLVALVITIIVLLILSGVTISTLTGENGLLNRAKTAKETSKNSSAEENTALESYETKIGEIVGGSIRSENLNLMDTLRFLSGETANSNFNEQLDEMVNSETSMNEIVKSENMSFICINSKLLIDKICSSNLAFTICANQNNLWLKYVIIQLQEM